VPDRHGILAHEVILMNKVGGGGLVLAGILIIVLGWLIQSPILEWLLDIIGFVIIAGGVIVVVVGLVKMFSGDGSGQSEF
jgi:hypothetical protein